MLIESDLGSLSFSRHIVPDQVDDDSDRYVKFDLTVQANPAKAAQCIEVQ